MAELTWTESDIETLRAALRTGVKRVRYRGPPEREVEYQSLGEMRALLAEMVSQVAGTTRYRRVKYSKGFRRARCA